MTISKKSKKLKKYYLKNKNFKKDIKNIVIIIGGQKCGTTSLYNYLTQSDEICRCFHKEPRYFSDLKRNRVGPPYLNKHRGHARQFPGLRYEEDYLNSDQYFSLWPDWDNKKHIFALEASCDYSAHPMMTYASNSFVAKRIKEFKRTHDVNIKLIYIVRDPISRIRSSYMHNHVSSSALEAPLKLPKKYVSKDIINYTNYFKIANEYKKYFPKKDLLIVKFEDMVKDKQMVGNKIAMFLNIKKFKIKDIPDTQSKEKRIRNKLKDYGTDRIFGMNRNNLIKWDLTNKQKNIIRDSLKKDIYKFSKVYKINISDWDI